MTPQEALRYHVTGAVERGEAEPVVEQRADLGVGHIWTAVACPVYRTLDGADCTCNAR